MARTAQQRIEKLARGRPGAMRVHENDAGVFVERWRPRLAGGFVGLDGVSNLYRTRAEAEACAREVKAIAIATLKDTPPATAPGPRSE